MAARTGVEPVYQPEMAYAYPRVPLVVASLLLHFGHAQPASQIAVESFLIAGSQD